jgi:MscS family membrane protein
VKIGTKTVSCRVDYLGVAVLIGLLFGFSCAAKSADINPLRPADTSSPKATLQGFVETIDELYLHMADLIKTYAASNRLCPHPRGAP